MRKLAIIALVTLLSGCAQSPVASTYTISQDDVRSISLTTKAPLTVSRVVVLANGVAEIIQSLNAQSIIVGRDISSTADSLADIPIVTSGHQVLPEKVIALKPDLVLIDASTGPKAAIETIKSAGITVIETPESWSLKDLPIKVRAVGRAIGAPEQAEELVQQLNDSLNASAVKNSPRVAFLYLRGTSSVYLIGGAGSGADSLLTAIGAIDVGAQTLYDQPRSCRPVGRRDEARDCRCRACQCCAGRANGRYSQQPCAGYGALNQLLPVNSAGADAPLD